MILTGEEKTELLRMLQQFGQHDAERYVEFLGEVSDEYAIGMCKDCGETSPLISACCGATVYVKKPKQSLSK